MYTELDYKNSLYHHGILGMRWGRKNGPPYPLGASDHSASEKKAGWRTSLKKDFKLTDRQKKVLKIGAAVAVTCLVAYGGYKLVTSPYGRKMVIGIMDRASKTPSLDDQIANMGPEIVKKSQVHDIVVDHTKSSISEVSKRIGAVPGRCNFNSFAGALDREHNIKIRPGAEYEGNIGDLITKCLKNTDGRLFEGLPSAKFTDSAKASEFILNRIAKGKEGAFGQIGSDLKGGDGHVFDWVVKNGKVEFYDTFVRTVSGGGKSLEDASVHFNALSGINGKITRLDGLTKDDFTEFANKLFEIEILK